jgi:hypothetical protein
VKVNFGIGQVHTLAKPNQARGVYLQSRTGSSHSCASDTSLKKEGRSAGSACCYLASLAPVRPPDSALVMAPRTRVCSGGSRLMGDAVEIVA